MKFKLDECLDVRLAALFYNVGMTFKPCTKKSFPASQMRVLIQYGSGKSELSLPKI